jgi:hypothetical protein
MLFSLFPSAMAQGRTPRTLEKKIKKVTTLLILNLKLLTFIDLKEILERFANIRKEFEELSDDIKEYLNYFETTLLNQYTPEHRNYKSNITIVKKHKRFIISEETQFTNNLVESLNSFLKMLLKGKKKISLNEFEKNIGVG